jgi:hypothetical protein
MQDGVAARIQQRFPTSAPPGTQEFLSAGPQKTCPRWMPWALAGLLAAGLFALTGRLGVGLTDEGYLWYGAVHTAQGEVPMRDFQSYSPGRYYWAAFFFKLLHDDGLIALRVSTVALDILGLALGLLVLRRLLPRALALAAAGVLLAVWMWPLFRAFDTAASLAAMFFATRLLERPSRTRYLWSGVCCGLVATLGVNHGAYCVFAFVGLIAYLRLTRGPEAASARGIGAWAFGVLVGYTPVLFMCATLPGFLHYLLKSLGSILHRGATASMPRAVRWPWTLTWSFHVVDLHRLTVATLYLVLPLFDLGLAAVLFVWSASRRCTVLVASLFVGIPYLHMVFSRSDVIHLASGIQPFLIGLLTLPALAPAGFPRRVTALAVWGFAFMASCLAVGYRGYLVPVQIALGKRHVVDYRVGHDVLRLTRRDAAFISAVKRTRRRETNPAEEILFIPYAPGLYSVLGIRSPLRNLLFIWPLEPSDQEDVIARLEARRVRWVLFWDIAWNRREELRFRNSQRLVWDYLQREFEALPVERELGANCVLFRRRSPGGAGAKRANTGRSGPATLGAGEARDEEG